MREAASLFSVVETNDGVPNDKKTDGKPCLYSYFLFHLQCVSYYLIPNAMRRFILLIVLAVVMCLSAIAHNFMFKHLEVRDGMPSNQINVIYKDSRGFMWFGTASGLARYDGYRFKRNV